MIIASNDSTYLQAARHWFAYIRPFVPHTGFFTRGQSHRARSLVSVRLPVQKAHVDSISTPLKNNNNNNHFENKNAFRQNCVLSAAGSETLVPRTPWVTVHKIPYSVTDFRISPRTGAPTLLEGGGGVRQHTISDSNLECGLAILTKSFSPRQTLSYTTSLVEVQSRQCVTTHTIPFYIICIKLD